MSCKITSSLSYVSTSLPSPYQSRRTSVESVQISSRKGLLCFQRFYSQHREKVQVVKSSRSSIHEKFKLNKRFPKPKPIFCGMPEDLSVDYEHEIDPLVQETDQSLSDEVSLIDSLCTETEGSGGKPGFISFYHRPNRSEDEIFFAGPQKNQNNLLWLIGPGVLVASFIFPSLYLRRILSTIFEDSLLTDFLILFFTEAIFYCGVAVFLLLIDYLRRPTVSLTSASTSNIYPLRGHRISSVTVLVLSLIIPMVTMGYVWPWTGPAASATLAPYLVGIVVQFAFEQYARYTKSPSWPVIPIIFQVYRLHQLNRAAQLVTALSYTVKGAEMTPHNLAISTSLGTLLNVLQFLGVICIWSLSSFIMRLLPSAPITEQ